MFIVKVRCFLESDEELGSIRVFPAIGHREHTGLHMWQELFVFEVTPHVGMLRALVNRSTSCTISLCDVSALHHKFWYDTMYSRSLVPEALLSYAESSEVCSSQRHFVVIEKKLHARRSSVVDCKVHEDILRLYRLVLLFIFRRCRR